MTKHSQPVIPTIFAIELEPKVITMLADSATLMNAIGFYEECGYPVKASISTVDGRDGTYLQCHGFSIRAEIEELDDINHFLMDRANNKINIWSWKMDYDINFKTEVITSHRVQNFYKNGPLLVIRYNPETVFIYGQPADLDKIQEYFKLMSYTPEQSGRNLESGDLSFFVISDKIIASIEKMFARDGHQIIAVDWNPLPIDQEDMGKTY